MAKLRTFSGDISPRADITVGLLTWRDGQGKVSLTKGLLSKIFSQIGNQRHSCESRWNQLHNLSETSATTVSCSFLRADLQLNASSL